MMMLAVASIPSPARAQSGADEPIEVRVHPAVTTVFHLPDEIEHARFTAPVAGSMQAKPSGHMLLVRPRRRARTGMVVSLEVKTATVRQRFRLRVVRRARDAQRTIVVQAAEPPPSAGTAALDDDTAAPGDQAAPSSAEAATATAPEPTAPEPTAPEPTAPEPTATATAPEPAATATESTATATEPTASPATSGSAPRAGHESARAGPVTAAAAAEQNEPVTTAAAGAPRFELAVHALVALPGFTSLELAGNAPGVTWRAHRGLGVRLTAGPAGGWWNLEADVSGTVLAGALTYEGPFDPNQLEVSGPLLRAEFGLRAGAGARWRSSISAGLGTQAHLRWTRITNSIETLQPTSTMADGVVLALGIGLHRRIGDVLLGLEVQVRRGGPDDYYSMTALWTVGYFLEPGP